MLFHEEINQFLQFLEYEKGLSSNTIVSYRSDLLQFLKFLGFNMLTQNKINEFMIDLNDRYSSSSTKRRKYSAMTQFFNFLYREGVISQEFEVESHRVQSKKRLPYVFTSVEIDLILKNKKIDPISIRNYAMMEVLFSSGMRVSELIHVTVYDVENVDTFIQVKGKGSKQRYVPLGRKARQALEHYLACSRPMLIGGLASDKLFLAKNGTALTRQTVFRIVKNRLEEIRVTKGSPHTFRHSFASALLEGGSDLREVQLFLGHESIDTTQVYTHLNRKKLRVNYNMSHPRG